MKHRYAATTERFVESINATQPHAVLLTGPVGVGLGTLARDMARSRGRLLAELVPESTTTALPSIGVERVRALYTETRSKLDGLHLVVIDDADTMNHVAQNSLLKLLEEPNPSIAFILTSHSPDKLLPTIRSRCQLFAVPPISPVESSRLLKALGVKDALTEQRLLYVAQGLPAELTRLVMNESDFKSLLEKVQIAKQLISGSPYQRLVVAASFSGDRKSALSLVDMALLLLRRSLAGKPDAGTLEMIERLMEASDAIRRNGNVKLHLAAAAA